MTEMSERKVRVNPCQNPAGLRGRLTLWLMNWRHSSVTDWGLSHVPVKQQDTILDAGCGGGRTVNKLAAMAHEGKVYGIDHSGQSVMVASNVNRREIEMGRVEIRGASVLQLPFADSAFDLVTAVETHFWWPDLPAGMKEIRRVLKPGGRLVIIAEIYKAANAKITRFEEAITKGGMKLLSVEDHRDLFQATGYTDVQIFTEPAKAWICCVGRKPS